MQYSRFDNSLSNANGFIDENLLNFGDSRHINLWSKNGKSNKNNNLLSGNENINQKLLII